MIYMCDIEGDASSGICRPIESSFASASIIGCALPSVRADVASALNSRVREIAIQLVQLTFRGCRIGFTPYGGTGHELVTYSK